MSLFKQLFEGEAAYLMGDLWLGDESEKKIATTEIAKRLMGDVIVTGQENDQLYAMLSQADFKKSEDEVVTVANTVLKYIRKADIFPKVIKHRGVDLANRCMLSLGFFQRT